MATASAPAPAAWTLPGILAWCAVPFNWAFIVVGLGAGAGSFLGLRTWLDDKPMPPPATDDDMKVVISKLSALEARLAADPAVPASAARDFAVAAEELARSEDPHERAAAAEIAGGNPIDAADRLMEELSAGKARNADRARRAARIYAPFAPSKARAAYEEAVGLDPTDVWAWIELARLRARYESLESAEVCLKIALQHVENDFQRSALETQLGELWIGRGDLREARDHHQAALEIDKRLADERPDAVRQHYLAISHSHLGRLSDRLRDKKEANVQWQAAMAIWTRLSAEYPSDTKFKWGIYSTNGNMGLAEISSGQFETARKHFNCAAAILEDLRANEPGNIIWRRDLAFNYHNLGRVESELGEPDRARQQYETARALQEQLVAQEPDNAEWQSDLLQTNLSLAQLEEGGKGA